MGALGHYLEAEGIATTGISLVREHTEAIRPPRALWVSFIFGRPFGVPNNAAFQRQVVMCALRLLESPAGPVLEDYPEDAPESDGDEHPFACPVSFARAGESGADDEVQREIAQLAPWYVRSRALRKRTSVGVSGLTPESAAKFLAHYIDDPTIRPYRETLDPVNALRLACHDLKAYYLESIVSQPGARSAKAAEGWFWDEAAAGKMLVKLSEACRRSDDLAVQRFGAKSIIPMAVARRRFG